jgi:MFS family permease
MAKGMTLPGLRAPRLGLFLWGAAEGLFIYLLPLQIRTLGGDDARAVGFVVAIQAAVAGISMFVGPIVDRMGRGPLIRFGATIVLPGMIIWAAAPHWQWMIVGTLFWAVSFAGYPAITAYVTASHDDHVGIINSFRGSFMTDLSSTAIMPRRMVQPRPRQVVRRWDLGGISHPAGSALSQREHTPAERRHVH